MPVACPDVPSAFLQPRNDLADHAAYDRQAKALATMFAENFVKYADGVSDGIRSSGPAVE